MRSRFVDTTCFLLVLGVVGCGAQDVVQPPPRQETDVQEMCHKVCARHEECGDVGPWGPPACMDTCAYYFESIVAVECYEAEFELLECGLEHYSCDQVASDEISSPRTDPRRAVCLEPYNGLLRCGEKN